MTGDLLQVRSTLTSTDRLRAYHAVRHARRSGQLALQGVSESEIERLFTVWGGGGNYLADSPWIVAAPKI
jgi:hypothetical protein